MKIHLPDATPFCIAVQSLGVTLHQLSPILSWHPARAAPERAPPKDVSQVVAERLCFSARPAIELPAAMLAISHMKASDRLFFSARICQLVFPQLLEGGPLILIAEHARPHDHLRRVVSAAVIEIA